MRKKESLCARSSEQAENAQNHQNGKNYPRSTNNSDHNRQKPETLPNRETLCSSDNSIRERHPQCSQHDPRPKKAASQTAELLLRGKTKHSSNQQPQNSEPADQHTLCDQSFQHVFVSPEEARFGETRSSRLDTVLILLPKSDRLQYTE